MVRVVRIVHLLEEGRVVLITRTPSSSYNICKYATLHDIRPTSSAKCACFDGSILWQHQVFKQVYK